MKQRNSILEFLIGTLLSATITLGFFVCTVLVEHPFFLFLSLPAIIYIANDFYKKKRKLVIWGLCIGSIPIVVIAFTIVVASQLH